MTFEEFAGEIAAKTGDFLESSFELVGQIPELSGQVADISREFVIATGESSAATAQRIIDLSSQAATAAGDLIENSNPADIIGAFKALLDTYNDECQNAATNTLTTDNIPADVILYPLGNDEVYITDFAGDGDIENWENGSPGRYPAGVNYPRPPVSPNNKNKNAKIAFTAPYPQQACVNKRVPQIGQVFYLDSFMNAYRQRFTVIRWWDNIRVFRQTNGGTFSPSTSTQYFKRQPSLIPSNVASILSASICSPPSAWGIQSMAFGKTSPNNDYYQDRWSCSWKNEFWMDGAFVGQPGQIIKYDELSWESGESWAECWTSSQSYGNPGGSWDGGYGIKANGWGQSELYTYAEAVFLYQGTVNPADIRPKVINGAYLAFQQIHAFNNILFTLLGGNYGKS